MRLIKIALISFVVFFIVTTAISLLFPSRIRISKAVNISSHTAHVLYLVNDFQQWPRWHPAFLGQRMDTVLQKNNIALTRIKSTDTLVMVKWQQGSKTPVLNSWQIHTFGAADSVALQWYMDFHLKWYPWAKFGSLFYESTYGQYMEQGLQNIKQILQQKDTSNL